jgi:hypothetical protein
MSKMNNNRNFPFRNLSREAWQNLFIVAFLAFYAGQVILDIAWNNYCGNLAIDYCAFWSAGKIANTDGYGQVYNLERLWEIQQPITSKYMSVEQYAPVPVPYLPIFIFPFQFFALLDVIPGFWLWTALNAGGTVAYLRFFIQKTSLGRTINTRSLLLATLALPVFLNLFQGQVNLWLMICTGEFLRKIIDNKPFQAGLWLGGLLLKPQILILIIPALLFRRLFSTIYGFTLTSFGLGIASLFLGGWAIIPKLIQLWIGYTGGLPSNYPEAMMNWRMVALNINALSNSGLGWWVAIPCLIATLLFALYNWKFSFDNHSPQFAVAILGTFAATSAIAWHSHFSMMMIVIPILLYLMSQDILPNELFSFWIFMPPILMLITYIIAPFFKTGLFPESYYPILNLLSGLRGLILNIYLLWWAVEYLKRKSLQNLSIAQPV